MAAGIQKRFDDVRASSTFARIARTLGLSEKRVLDIGCGYGEYLQRFGDGSAGITSTLDELEYGRTNGIDIRRGNAEKLTECIAEDEYFDAFWCNNLFEHLLAPHAFLVRLKQHARADALLVLGVPVVPKLVSLTNLKKFRGSLASPHINFFTKKTLLLTVERAGWQTLDCRSFFFSSATLDRLTSTLMPHLYVVARNNPAYRYPEKKLGEWKDDPHYHDLLAIMRSR